MDAAQITGIVIGTAVVATGVIAVIENSIRNRLRFPSVVTEKTCFLVSDKDWRAILELVPIAYRSRPVLGSWLFSFFLWIFMHIFSPWIEPSIYNHLRKNPVQIFHEEDGGAIDADSVIYFLQQFSPDRLYLIGDTPPELDALLIAAAPHGAGLSADIIYRTYPEDYPSFWLGIHSAVIVGRDNYQAALMASVFASLESIPVFLLDSSNLDPYKHLIDERKIYVIGELDAAVSDFINVNTSSRIDYTLQELIDKYIFQTKTQKIIIINPNDLNISVSLGISGFFSPEKSVGRITEVFSRSSLSASVLAAGRHEIIIFPNVAEPEYTDYDQIIENYIIQGKIYGKYLTILGSPNAIPQSIPADPPTGEGHRLELDGRYYGSVREDLHYVDLATGRIYGITPSDVSANIARSLFYDYLPRNRNALVLPLMDWNVSNPGDEIQLENYYRDRYWTDDIESKFDTTTFYSGIDEITDNIDDVRDKYDEVNLILFAGHGTTGSFGRVISTSSFTNDHICLMNPTVLSLACDTGAFDRLMDYDKPSLFVVQSIRHGVIVQIAAVSVSYWHMMFDEMLDTVYLQKKSLGEAFRLGKNSEYNRNAYNFHSVYRGDPWYFLMGDPAFKPRYW